MCGFFGYIGTSSITRARFARLASMLRHRGPDSESLYSYDGPDSRCLLYHSRLRILDLSINSDQPYLFEDLALVFNGEIYNYRELRRELCQYGYNFSSSSDTEVLIKCFHKWGLEGFRRLDGMYSFALLDKSKKRLHVVRDPLGVKPVYTLHAPHGTFFSSEFLPLTKITEDRGQVDNESLVTFLNFGFMPSGSSLYKNIKKVLPGTCLTLDLASADKHSSILCDISKVDSTSDQLDTRESIKRQLKSACLKRLDADVPIGSFLSGGYDSSLVTAVAQRSVSYPINTFSLGFDDKSIDESGYAKAVSEHLGTIHHPIKCTKDDLLNSLGQLPLLATEPLADPAFIPTAILSQYASRYCKIVLTGDGGDELFLGYNKYKKIGLLLLIKTLLPEFAKEFISSNLQCGILRNLYTDRRRNRAIDYLRSSQYEVLYTYESLFHSFSSSSTNISFSLRSCQRIYDIHERVSNLPISKQIQISDLLFFLSDGMLAKVDRATMSAGIEARSPFLDTGLVRSALRYRMSLNSLSKSKDIIREMCHLYIPKRMMDRPKQGFKTPIPGWLSSVYPDLLYPLLKNGRITKYLDSNHLTELYNSCILSIHPNSNLLYRLLVLSLWIENTD